jgi:O-antigen/teichoic acid export membrane protein
MQGLDNAATRTAASSDRPLPRLGFRRNFSWAFAGSSGYAASQWIVLMLLAKLGSPEMVGQLSLALAVTAPIFLLTNLSLRNVQATDTSGRFQFSHYRQLRLVSLPFAIALTFFVVALSGLSAQTAIVVVLIAAAKTVESLSDLYYGMFQRAERMDHVAVSMLLRGGGSAVTVGIVLYFTASIVLALLGLLLVWSLVLAAHDTTRSMFSDAIPAQPSHAPGTWHAERLQELFVVAAPLGGVACLVSLTAAVPRYYVGLYVGEGALGVFAAMAYFVFVGTTVITALSQSTVPRLARLDAEGRTKDFNRLLVKLLTGALAVGLAAVTASWLFGEQLLRLVYTEAFTAEAGLFTVIMAGGALSYAGSLLMTAAMARRRFRALLIVWAGIAGLTVVASIMTIPVWGLTGAAWTTVLVGAIHIAAGSVLLSRKARQSQTPGSA